MNGKIQKSLSLVILLLSLQITCFAQANDELLQQDAREAAVADGENGNAALDNSTEILNQKHIPKIDINRAQKEEWSALDLLSSNQIDAIFNYKQQYGAFISVYELQAVDALTLDDLHDLLPYLSCNLEQKINVKNLLSKGSYQGLTRVQFSPGERKNEKYFGEPFRFFLRYRYRFGSNFSYGFSAEKDQGEALFKKPSLYGFDFYSAHIFYKGNGPVKTLALGDFEINIGQALLIWTGFAMNKSSMVLQTEKEAFRFRPYVSANESRMMRGAALELGGQHWTSYLAASYKRKDAYGDKDSTTALMSFSSFNESGYHRDSSEWLMRHNLGEFLCAAGSGYKGKNLRINANFLFIQYDKKKEENWQPYNTFHPSGGRFLSSSIDYHWQFRNVRCFGEIAWSFPSGIGAVNGLILSLGKRFDMTILYRYYSVNFNPIYSRSFGANSKAQNEQGLYLAASYTPKKSLRIDAALDVAYHPWLQYRQSNYSCNYDALLQCSYMPSKKAALLIRFKHASSSSDLTAEEQKVSDPVAMQQEQLRLQSSIKLLPSLLLGNRIENIWIIQSGKATEYGMLLAQDISWKNSKTHLSLAGRIAYYQTGGYNSRVYAHEPDLAFSYSMPVFQGKGYRYSIQIAYRFRRFLDLSLRWAQGFDANNPSAISSKDLKFQTFINF